MKEENKFAPELNTIYVEFYMQRRVIRTLKDIKDLELTRCDFIALDLNTLVSYNALQVLYSQ